MAHTSVVTQYRRSFQDVYNALTTWFRTKDGALPPRVLLRLAATCRDWQCNVLHTPLYLDLCIGKGMDRRWMTINLDKEGTGLRARSQRDGSPLLLRWGKSGDEPVLIPGHGRRDFEFRGRSPWTRDEGKHVCIVFNPLFLCRDVKLENVVLQDVGGLGRELLRRMHTRAPAAFALWESIFKSMTVGGPNVLQFDWPAYYRHWDWHGDLLLLQDVARMWGLCGVPRGQDAKAFLVYSIMPSTHLSVSDFIHGVRRMTNEGRYFSYEVMNLEALASDNTLMFLSGKGEGLSPMESAALRVVVVREPYATSLAERSAEAWRIKCDLPEIPPGREKHAREAFLQNFGFPLHDAWMAGPLPDDIESEQTIMLNIRRYVRFQNGKLTSRDERVAAGGVPLANVLRLRFGEETFEAHKFGPPERV